LQSVVEALPLDQGMPDNVSFVRFQMGQVGFQNDKGVLQTGGLFCHTLVNEIIGIIRCGSFLQRDVFQVLGQDGMPVRILPAQVFQPTPDDLPDFSVFLFCLVIGASQPKDVDILPGSLPGLCQGRYFRRSDIALDAVGFSIQFPLQFVIFRLLFPVLMQ